MSDVLSQSEIDELLSALSSGEILPEQLNEAKEKQQVKKYDFRTPKKFSKEHIRTLEMVHENYARVLSGYLTAQIRTNVQVKVAIIEQITYEEFIKSISAPTILVIYRMPPLLGSLLFETNPQFVFQMIDILFGGAGKTSHKTREFTEIEKNVIKSINIKLIENLKIAWEDILEVDPQLMEIETNPALNQTMAPNEPVAIITLSIKMNDVQTYINLCIPYVAIEKVMDKMVVHYWVTTPDGNNREETRQNIEKRIQNVSMELTTVLGSTQITIKSFLDLQVGDVIQLKKGANEAIDTYVEDKMRYKVLPGISNKKKAVRVVEIIEEEVE